MAITESHEDTEFRLASQPNESQKDFQQMKSSQDKFHNVEEYLNANIKPLTFTPINISSKTTHSENQTNKNLESLSMFFLNFCS